MAKQQARFVEGAMANGVKKEDAVYIFELVDKFAGYGFNKSHAAAYALVSYHTAYMKANFREEFFAASMTSIPATLTSSPCSLPKPRRAAFAWPRPASMPRPSISLSNARGRAKPTAPSATRWRHSRTSAPPPSKPSSTIAKRTAPSPLSVDFASRLNAKAFNKRALETLASAGAFDSLEGNRALVHGNVDGIMALCSPHGRTRPLARSDLFAGASGAKPTLDLKQVQGWTPMEKLQAEFESIGFLPLGSPARPYEKVLAKLGVKRYVDFEAAVERGASAARSQACQFSARAPLGQRQQVRLRHDFGHERPIRSRHLFGYAHAKPRNSWLPVRPFSSMSKPNATARP